MSRCDLKHIDRGVIYIPMQDDMSDQEVNNIIEENKRHGHTVVLLRSGKYNMKNTLKELIKTTLNT